MKRHAVRWLLALAVMGLSVAGAEALAADYATIVLSTEVARPATEVWKKVGGFCEIRDWMKVTCEYTSGSGGLGSVRRLAGRIEEVMVGKTAYSYTYTQPNTKVLYHGTLAVEPEGPHRSKLVYSIFYDQSDLTTDEAKAKSRARYTMAFTRALDSMKKLAEGK